jgi:hypothetical protein
VPLNRFLTKTVAKGTTLMLSDVKVRPEN